MTAQAINAVKTNVAATLTAVTNDAPTIAPAATAVISASQSLLAASKLVSKNMARVSALDEAISTQRDTLIDAKGAVTKALEDDGDFSAAGRVFKAANNKLDRMIEQRETVADDLHADIDAVRNVLAEVSKDARSLVA
jgi:hypothetical protein